jgi:hypothetical protein
MSRLNYIKERNRLRGKVLKGFPWQGKFTTKSDIDEYFSNPEGIQCLLCGRIYKTLNGHLQIVHDISFDDYRARYGLPWRRGLVSPEVSKRLSDSLTERIRNGSFKPEPDNRAAVKRLRAGGRRKDQPYLTAIKIEKARGLSKKNIRYSREDFENVLSVMMERKIALRETCMDRGLPPLPTVLAYAESHPGFRKKLIDTYYALPYAVQARADMFSPQFYEDLKQLKAKGLPATEIGKKLGVSHKTVRKRLNQME